MTERERVIASLNHEQPDATPYNIGFTEKAKAKMAAYYGDSDFERHLGNAFHVLYTTDHTGCSVTAPEVWRDEFGVEWDRSVDRDIGVVRNQVITADNLEEFAFPDPESPGRWEAYTPIPESAGDRFVLTDLGFSLFERAWTMHGMENLLMAMACNADFAHRLFDRILEYNLEIIDRVCAYPVDAMMFGDDWGSQQGLIMGPEMWHQFIGPRVKQMYQRVHDHGKYVFIHSCGRVDSLFPSLIEYGLDCFNPFQPEVIDVFEAKKQYGGRLSFYGGISTQKTLPYATPDQTREEVKRLIGEVGKDGGLIAAPAHAIPADASTENMAAMIDVLQNQ